MADRSESKGARPGRGLFIAGTDTGVGKTVAAASIALGLESLGRGPVCVMKPIETGCRMRGGRLIASDAEFHRKMLDSSEPGELLCPVRLRPPVAPVTAAKMEKRRIGQEDWRPSFDALVGRHAFVIVEGAGGVMVPVREDYLISDMISELEIPCVVVARTSLGTINHTLLTVEHLLTKGIPVLGLVFNRTGTATKPGIAERTGPGLVSRIARIPVLGIIPGMPSITRDALRRTGKRISENLISVLEAPR